MARKGPSRPLDQPSDLADQDALERHNRELLRQRAELESARDRYAEVFDLAPLPCLIVTQTGIIEEANRTAAEFLRREPRQIQGRPLTMFVPLSERARFRKFLIACQRSTKQVSVETELDFEPRVPVQVLARSAGGRNLHLAIVDLSARRWAEAERQKLLSRAEGALAASAAKDRFLASLSHELRTPLTPVLAAVSALRGRDLPPDAQGLLGLIERSVSHEVRLIDDLLDLSRLTHNKMTFDRKVLDLHEVVTEALELVGPEIAAKELNVEVDLRARQHHVRGDPVRLRQVFTNLLRNACKFTPRAGTVAVQSRWGRRGVVVEVSDMGVGIPPHQLPLIFDSFAQGEQGEKQGGLGLGLSIARGIVEAHDGRISVSSEGVGHGATFEVELDCVSAPTGRTAAKRARIRGGDHRRILLVEDHDDTAEVLSELLASQGFQIERARSVGEAIQKVDGSTQLIISDIGLPDGTGLDVMRQLRGRRLGIPGIVLSGYGSREDRRRSLAAGFARHLVKPITLEELVAAIREVQ